jgi:probable F420-dependent oxidoreductase
MKRYGMTIPLETRPLLEQRDWIRELVDLGYTDLWSSEAQDVDGFTPLALASQWAPSLNLGCACFPAQTRGPALLAMSIAALCQAAPGRFTVGIGASSSFVVEHWNGIPYQKPYQRTRDVARFLRSALAGEKIHHAYETFTVKNFRLRRAVEEPPQILIAALRKGMLELAGRVGDGALLNWIGADDLPTVIPHVKKGGEHRRIVARVVVSPTTDSEKVRGLARFYCAAYLNVPTYRAHQEWLGRGPLLAKTFERWEAGDRKGAAAAVPDEVVDTFYLHGPPEKCREELQRFLDGGVDTLILAFLEGAVDPIEASRQLAPR